MVCSQARILVRNLRLSPYDERPGTKSTALPARPFRRHPLPSRTATHPNPPDAPLLPELIELPVEPSSGNVWKPGGDVADGERLSQFVQHRLAQLLINCLRRTGAFCSP